ncbi:DUF4176 domain-containing protein [Anaerosacchariphilus polymeriproducens]|uniref:DUF4176 domain-containing protein n=1 Tax=Anaerosacchariphilus polymeriproducens TaxID=1812858 RepID=A0A371ARS3_9FIRM|nr:DUF4176 domain-containing protein [Anaerosacchariphilus polymeriproducens]RDU22254.1 DUF4176 domain-containing protein [Anaerosacchariphilus polymeriproducens]
MKQEEKKEIEQELFRDVLEKQEVSEQKELMKELFENRLKEREALIEFYEFLKGNESVFSHKNITCTRSDNQCMVLTFSDKELRIEQDKLRKLVRDMKDLKEEILPVGSVVDLKKDKFQNFPGIEKVDKIRVNIIHRFLLNEGSDTYFTYAGVIYPIGAFGGKDCIQFTGELISKVVFKGFSDQEEEAFVYLIKRGLLLEQNRNSFEAGETYKIQEGKKEE